jgi:hypothetical protein
MTTTLGIGHKMIEEIDFSSTMTYYKCLVIYRLKILVSNTWTPHTSWIQIQSQGDGTWTLIKNTNIMSSENSHKDA